MRMHTRITAYGFDMLTKTDEHNFQTEFYLETFSSYLFPLQHSFHHFYWQSLSEGKENQKVKALICTNHNVHD